jgi:hypothetical protein
MLRVNPVKLKAYRLAESEKEFWRGVTHPLKIGFAEIVIMVQKDS